MLEIGDIVKVRPRLSADRYYGGRRFDRKMKIYRSMRVKITGKISLHTFKIDADRGEWIWSEEMFTEESVAEAVKRRGEKKDFKTGDVVIGNDIADTMYGTTKKGYIATVINVVNDHIIQIQSDKGDIYDVDKKAFDLYNPEEKKSEASNEMLEKLANSIDELAKEVKKEDPFKQAMIEGIIEKGKELATKDLREDLKKDLDKFIQETYGALPKKIVIERETKTKELEGIFHKDFEKICKIVDSNIPLMLVGGAGAGKNYTLEQVAKALDLTFYTTNAVNQDYKLTGFIDANGKYHETEFYKAFVNGGMFFLDEIDASCPEALVTLNSAIANKYFDFPIGRVTANPNFRIVCAGNTYGTGADMVYVGRNVLDGATLDRFVVLEFDYDDEVEKQLAFDEELYKFIKDLRNAVNKAGLRYIVSMRALINSTKLLEIGIDKNTILKTTVIKNMQKDDLNTVIGKLEITSSDWFRELKRLCD